MNAVGTFRSDREVGYVMVFWSLSNEDSDSSLRNPSRKLEPDLLCLQIFAVFSLLLASVCKQGLQHCAFAGLSSSKAALLIIGIRLAFSWVRVRVAAHYGPNCISLPQFCNPAEHSHSQWLRDPL